MATQTETNLLDVTEQLERIHRMSAQSDKLHEERLKLKIARLKLDRESAYISKDYSLRIAAVAATFTAGLIAATATVIVILLHH